jgi:hypothetical protein
MSSPQAETCLTMFRWNTWIKPSKPSSSITPIMRSTRTTWSKNKRWVMANKIIIDVLTLDSVQCEEFGYMMESIAVLPTASPKAIQGAIEYEEWSIDNKEGVGKVIEIKGKVLPIIAIQGNLLFESIIPQYEELIEAMADRAPNAELATKIRVLHDKGFDFDNLEAKLTRAEPGMKTRREMSNRDLKSTSQFCRRCEPQKDSRRSL